MRQPAGALGQPGAVAGGGRRRAALFNPDLEPEGTAPPPDVHAWREALRASDAVLVASPEYGHSLPGALKNAIDWVIGSGELHQKAVAITAAVPSVARGRMGLAALRQTLLAVDVALVGGEPGAAARGRCPPALQQGGRRRQPRRDGRDRRGVRRVRPSPSVDTPAFVS